MPTYFQELSPMLPPGTAIEPDIVARAEVSAAPVPLAELLEVVGPWPGTAAGLAAQVTVPVQFLAFEFEQLWTIDPESVQAFAAYFEHAASVDDETELAGIAISTRASPPTLLDAAMCRNGKQRYMDKKSWYARVCDDGKQTLKGKRTRRVRRCLAR